MVKFVEETNTINDFKNYLKEKNISPRNYFKGKFESVIDKKNNIQNKYSFTYSQPLPGPSFLNNYIIFVKQQTTDMFKKQVEINIINEIKIHQHHLEIAKKIDLHNPILISIVEGRSVVSEPDALFYKGTKVLTQKIISLNKLLNETKNFKLDYEFILEQASAPILDSNPLYFFMSIASAFGLLFSIIIVFIKFYFLKLKL